MKETGVKHAKSFLLRNNKKELNVLKKLLMYQQKIIKIWYYYMEWKGHAGSGSTEYGFGKHFLSSASF